MMDIIASSEMKHQVGLLGAYDNLHQFCNKNLQFFGPKYNVRKLITLLCFLAKFKKEVKFTWTRV